MYEIELGLPVEEFIYSDEYCGGILHGRKLKAVVAGGSSVPILPADLILKTAAGEPRLMSYESLAEGGFATGTMLGSGGFIVMDESTDIVHNLYTFTRFYHHESCGQCSPCREGTGWMEKILHKILDGHGTMTDIDLLWDIQRKIEGNTICPLGDAAAWRRRPAAKALQRGQVEAGDIVPDQFVSLGEMLKPGVDLRRPAVDGDLAGVDVADDKACHLGSGVEQAVGLDVDNKAEGTTGAHSLPVGMMKGRAR